MISGTEAIIGPRGLTKNQVVQLVATQYGGWPVRAASLWAFESADPKETVYRFVDEQGIAIEKRDFRKLAAPLWNLALSRDDFMTYYLSREAKEKIMKLGQDKLTEKIMGAVGRR